ncbi:MAG TPA: agmatine deiminase family protein [Actinomycetota bacterium]
MRGATGSDLPRRRWPGEWEPHEATMMAMPHRAAIYGTRLAAIRREWIGLVRAIAEREPVHAVVPPGTQIPVADKRVRTTALTYDDMWIRDNGPVLVLEDGGRIGLDWIFDGWGGAFDGFGQTWADDDRLPEPLLAALGVDREPVPMVLEGGAILSGGDGTVLTTRENVFEAGRNPAMSDAEIERELLARLGASTLIALPYGLIGDLTGGHVDGVAAFLGPGRVLAQTDPAGGEEGERLDENVSVLKAAADASGVPLDVVEFPYLARGAFRGLPPGTFTYVNLIHVDGAVIVPTTGDERIDRGALGALSEIVTDREVVGLPAPTMNWAGGGFHCVTQPLPAP